MDRNFDIDDFEELLKERSDEFKMYPAKRVWYSIYNNIHPGKKWPSVATCVTLIATLLLVGYLNSGPQNIQLAAIDTIQSGHDVSVNLSSSFYNPFIEKNIIDYQNPEASVANNAAFGNFVIPGNKESLEAKLSTSSISFHRNTNENRYSTVTNNTFPEKYNLAVIQSISKNELSESVTINNDLIFATTNRIQLNDIEKSRSVITDGSKNSKNSQSAEKHLDEVVAFVVVSNLNDIEKNAFSLPDIFEANKNDLAFQENIMSDEDKAWVENYALYNRPAPKKWAGKLRSQFYITPSVVYRQLKNTIITDQDINKEVIQHPSVGVELGAGIMYPLSSWLKIKTGLQFNFTRYNADGYGNSHPTATSITLTTMSGQHYQALRSTPYSNNYGLTPLQLHNETFQISLPLGMDIKLAGSENIQWNIGATIQPAYVFGGKSYLISSDKRNYVKETGMLNRLNLNAGFETYISYKTNSGFTFQFGPQFRKQIYTTNKSQYSIQEKLTSYGLKFGVSKLIK